MYKTITDFIRELYKIPEGVVPLHAPVFLGNEKKYLIECIDSTYVSYKGDFVLKFEQLTAAYTGVKYAHAVVNGTAALHIALVIAGVEASDEVITQPLTFVATANAIRHANAYPIFVDVDLDTLGMSPEKLEDFLKRYTEMRKEGCINKKSGRRIKAVIPMHTFGHPCRIDEIVTICKNYGLIVIEDAAESLGSLYKGKHTGTFGEAGIISYNGNKTITTGGGGMIITDDEEFAKKVVHLTTTAKLPHKYEYVHDAVAYNYRLTNVNAAIGVAQMERIDKYIENKRETALKYKTFFSNIDVMFFNEPKNTISNFWLNTILLNRLEERNNFLKYTNDNGIVTRPIWKLLNKLEMYKNCQTGNLDNAQWLEERIVNIPSGYRN